MPLLITILKNIETLSSLYISIEQNVQKNVLSSVQGQGLWGSHQVCLTCNEECPSSRPWSPWKYWWCREEKGLIELLWCKNLLHINPSSGYFVHLASPRLPVPTVSLINLSQSLYPSLFFGLPRLSPTLGFRIYGYEAAHLGIFVKTKQNLFWWYPPYFWTWGKLIIHRINNWN